MRQDDFDVPEVFRRAMEEAGWRLEEEEEWDNGPPEGPPRRPLPPPGGNRRYGRLLALITVLLIALFSVGSIASFYTDWLWFGQLGFRDLFTTQLVTRAFVFVVTFLVAAAILLGNWLVARRRAARATTPQQLQILQAAPIGLLIWLAGLGLAVLFAGAAAGQWEQILLFINRVPFEVADPIFGRDVSFYVFQLPVYEFIQGWLVSIVFIALLGLLPIYAAPFLPEVQRGAWQPLRAGPFRQHAMLLGGLFLLIWAAAYGLDIYRLLFSSRGVGYGASYTDLTAAIWGLRLELIFMFFTALALFLNAFREHLRLAVIAGGLWLFSALVVSGLLPGILQRYVVEPNELTLEAPYIDHNIEFTRRAFLLDEIESRPFGDVEDLSPQDLLENESILQNIRLWDYRPLLQTYQQLQALRPYYEFAEVDIDRYEIDGQQRQVMLAPRELDKTELPAPSWVNRNLEFTHGYGLVMNPVNEVTPEGQPDFFIEDLPPVSRIELEVTRPEVYFGELTDDTVYVSSGREEFSYPSGDANVYSSYAGTGGIVLDSFLKRLAFAIRQSDANVLLSNDINSTTRVQFNRQIQERIRTITPFLWLDADPYMVVTPEGRLVWIQDAYTVSNDYPYSTPIGVTVMSSTAGRDQTTAGLPAPARSVNYMRNAVKVVLDAYDGDVTYYLTDENDPIIQSYSQAFPGVFKPLDSMPEALRAHLRYPVDMFWVQARQYLTYHMLDTRVFYNKEDLWQIPTEIFEDAQQLIEPYYVTLALPGEDELEYLLIMPFVPATKNNMIAWMAARNDTEHYGELVVYELPKQELIFGPIQVEGRIDQDPAISAQFSLWDQRGSQVIRGNLLVLPINQSFLYVEPIYLLSETNALPELRRIITASESSIAMEETLDQSLLALAASTVARGSTSVPGPDSDIQVDSGAEPVVPAPTPAPLSGDATVEELVVSANGHLRAAEQAQRDGDWALYGLELEALRLDLERLTQLTSEVP